MEHEFRPEVRKSIPITDFFRHFHEYDIQTCAFSAVVNGLTLFTAASAIEDLIQGNIGTAMLKSYLNIAPFTASYITCRLMLDKIELNTFDS